MTIRTRLLLLLLPTIIVIIAISSTALYINRKNEIMNDFKTCIQTITITCSQFFKPEDNTWITSNLNDLTIASNTNYLKYKKALLNIKNKSNITNIYTAIIIPSNNDKDGHHEQIIVIDANESSESTNIIAPLETYMLTQNEKNTIYQQKR